MYKCKQLACCQDEMDAGMHWRCPEMTQWCTRASSSARFPLLPRPLPARRRSVCITKQVSFCNRALILFDWLKAQVFGWTCPTIDRKGQLYGWRMIMFTLLA